MKREFNLAAGLRRVRIPKFSLPKSFSPNGREFFANLHPLRQSLASLKL
jgi:hypothetical protein